MMHNRPSVIIVTVGLFFCLIQVVTSTVSSSYSGSLSPNSGVYFRPGQTSNSYYYQAIELTFSTIATYIFRSNGSLDTYGYLYSVSFDPLYPTRNLIASDDDSGGSGQFLFNATLTFGTRYILVVTTFYPGITGSYSITTLGPSSVNFFPLPPPSTTAVPSTPATSTTTSAPLVPSYYYGSLTQNSGVYFRPGQTSNSYYYQAIELTFSTIATYTFRSNGSLDTYGYLYSVSFDPLYPTRNLIASDDDSGGSGQFLFNATLTFGTRYILVVTTFYPGIIGAYSITTLGPSSVNFFPLPPPTTTAVPSTTTSGPAPVFPSTYTSSLSASSETFIRPGKISGTYRYEAIRVAIYTSTSGRYTFRSNSSLDTYGYLYNGSFNPFNPSLNLIASDDDSGGSGQFLFNVTLTYDNVYILVVTTYSPNVTGVYTVTALGPASVYFFPLVTTTTTASTTTSQAQVPSYYSSSLSQNSGIYTRSGQSSGSYYYESIQVVLYSSARYILRSSSTLDTYGYLYSGSFDPLNPSLNLIAFDDDSGGDRQFLLNVTLIYGTRYILVVTTYNPSVTGPYGVAVLGPSSVYFLPYNPTTVAPTTTTTAPSVPSSYSDALSSSSGIYTRPGQTSNAYYYQAIGVIVYTSGKYTFRSSSALDTYGYFYSSSFDSSNPLQNLIASDDDSGGDRQFLLNVTLTYGTRYILVVTTYAPNTAGSFSINSLGPAIVSWNEIPPTFGFALDAVEISFVAISCIVFLGIILSACAYRRSRQRTINRTAVYLTSDRKTQPNSSVVSETVGMPYVVSTNYARLSSGEKPSLSNE